MTTPTTNDAATPAVAAASEWDTPFFSFKKQVEVKFDSDGHGALHAREFIPKGFVFWHGTPSPCATQNGACRLLMFMNGKWIDRSSENPRLRLRTVELPEILSWDEEKRENWLHHAWQDTDTAYTGNDDSGSVRAVCYHVIPSFDDDMMMMMMAVNNRMHWILPITVVIRMHGSLVINIWRRVVIFKLVNLY